MKTTLERKRAMLYARLASLPSLNRLTEAEKNSLIAAARTAGFRWLDYVHQAKDPLEEWRMRAKKLGPIEEWSKERRSSLGKEVLETTMQAIWHNRRSGQPQPAYWDALKVAHEKGRPLILGLLKNGHADLRPLSHLLAPVLQTHTDHASRQQFEVEEIWPNPTLEEEILYGLIQFLRQPRCALRWCPGPYCGRVFVPDRGQRYCSRKCLMRGIGASDKESRREYMREYMAKRRRVAKEGKAKAA